MQIQISDHFTYKKIFRFVFPPIIGMVFTSIYGVVDGVFVSNLVGKTSFASVNLIMPLIMIFGTFGFMIGTGGSALVAMLIGKGEREKANKVFSMLIYSSFVLGIIITVIGFFILEPVAIFFGAEGELLNGCITYGRIILIAITAFMLQNVFQSFMIASEKPKLGMSITIIAGLTNIILDALFIAVFHWGLKGAAFATLLSQCVGGFIPLIYFLLPNSSLLRLCKTKFSAFYFFKACGNGSSEFMTNVSLSLVNMIYNFQLMRFAGENGIAAYGVIMYVNFIFIAVFIGYSMGTAPIVSYNYGAENKAEMKNIFRKSLLIISSLAIIMTGAAQLLSSPLSKIFVGYDSELFEFTKHAFRLYSISFLILGFNIYGSSFFTALNNGFISALISFLRTLVFQSICIIFLPLILGTDGIWLSITIAESLALLVTILCLISYKKRYGY